MAADICAVTGTTSDLILVCGAHSMCSQERPGIKPLTLGFQAYHLTLPNVC